MNSGVGEQVDLQDLLCDAAAALDAANQVLLGAVPPEELGAAVLQVQELTARVDALVCRVSAAATAAAVPQHNDCRKLGEYVAANSNPQRQRNPKYQPPDNAAPPRPKPACSATTPRRTV